MSNGNLLHGVFVEGIRTCHMGTSFAAPLSTGAEDATSELPTRHLFRGEQKMAHENLLQDTFVEGGNVCHMRTSYTAPLSRGAMYVT